MRYRAAVVLIVLAALVACAAQGLAQQAPTSAASGSAMAVGGALTGAAAKGAAYTFVKIQRRHIPRERVWFNGREGDLERHAICYRGVWYITLTDMVRHLGGTIVWGPSRKFIEVRRKGTVIQIVPGKHGLWVAGQPCWKPPLVIQRGNTTWVAVCPFAQLLGATATWNPVGRRIDVTFTP
ncbi:MAG: hypothetical protein H5T86_12230 [Armatimonadetes bacterium]|nr:hypothetical protein [Armatimonadota bacterium]